MRILFDQGTPVPLREFLVGHTVRTAAEQQWATLENGRLLDAAEAAGFELLVTTDKNMRYQQSLVGRRIAVIILGQARWPLVRLHVQRVLSAVDSSSAGTYTEIDMRDA